MSHALIVQEAGGEVCVKLQAGDVSHWDITVLPTAIRHYSHHPFNPIEVPKIS